MRNLLILSFLIISLNASFLLDEKNICIDNYYVRNNKFYYHEISSSLWKNTTKKNYASSIINNYIYNSNTNICSPAPANFLGLENSQFSFLMALSGLIFSSIIFFILSSFLVGF